MPGWILEEVGNTSRVIAEEMKPAANAGVCPKLFGIVVTEEVAVIFADVVWFNQDCPEHFVQAATQYVHTPFPQNGLPLPLRKTTSDLLPRRVFVILLDWNILEERAWDI